MGGYTSVVSGQRLAKHVPAAIETNTTVEESCFLSGSYRDISKGRGQSLMISIWVSVKRGLEPGGRGIVIVGAVARQPLVTD
jgi:hypothetical protein